MKNVRKKAMQKEIAAFERAHTTYKNAEYILGKAVLVELNKRNTLEELYSLVCQLPTTYFGVRFVYEKIYRIKRKKRT